MLSPDTIKAIELLAAELNNKFDPPEFIPGCVVKDVSDKDSYATNNGWIEALVSRHNQQRCRYRGFPPSVAVSDTVDVLYFRNFQLFTVFGQGGTGSINSVKNNYGATAAPVVGDDTDDGYSPGSIWIDTTNDNAYVCLDATAGAAVWEQIDGGASSGFMGGENETMSHYARSQSISSGSWQDLNLTQRSWEEGSGDVTFSGSNYGDKTIDIGSDGVYLVSIKLKMAGDTSAWSGGIRIGGSTRPHLPELELSFNANDTPTLSTSTVVPLYATDILRFQALQDSGSNMTVSDGTITLVKLFGLPSPFGSTSSGIP